jgi:putative CocE/NonD family hydrolase
VEEIRSSQPGYKVRLEKDVYFKMRDGIRLASDVYRPDGDGKFPALISLSPYGKEHQRIGLPPQPSGSPLWDGTVEAGDTDYLVLKGYAHIIADIRGTGYSEGQYVGLFPKEEGRDGYDLVEAIAAEPWCDGNVGMIGMSYFGATQLLTAAERPPHLKAICPYQASSDLYWMGYDGGILSAFLHILLGIHIGSSGIAPRNIASAMIKDLSKEELNRRI